MNATTLRQLLRLLQSAHYSNRRIAKLVGTAPNTVRRYRKVLKQSGMAAETIKSLSDSQLSRLLVSTRQTDSNKRLPDWAHVHHLMQARHQTLIQLWEDYRSISPADAYCYSQFTHYYREYTQSIDVTMRQYYRPGEVCFVDFAGKRIPWTDSQTGEVHQAEIFVGVLGYSQYIFAIALRSQKLEEWLLAHQKMFAFYGGVPELVVPDNLKSAVTTPGSIPVLNASYSELAEHYSCVIEPARVRRPQDKSLAEIGVLLVTRWITVVLRRRSFFSVAEINIAIAELLDQLNQRPFKRFEGNRLTRFVEFERPSLNGLPEGTFQIGRWLHQQKVNRDYHVYVHGHAYSVPYELTSQHVDIKVCAATVEIYFEHKLVATHIRSVEKGGGTTLNSHRPKSHQAYAAQSKTHFERWARQIGENTLAVVLAQFNGKPDHSMQGGKASNQLQKLGRQYGHTRLEQACRCACNIQSLTVSSVRSILQCRLDEAETSDMPQQTTLPLHYNVRGADYYMSRGSGHE